MNKKEILKEIENKNNKYKYLSSNNRKELLNKDIGKLIRLNLNNE